MARADSAARTDFEAAVRSLEGVRVSSVDYWDVHNFGPEPAAWDYGDWHHAVMGVQLTTDAGPKTVTWTNRFHPYGIDVLPDPIEHHLVLGEFGPQRIGPQAGEPWSKFIGTPVRSTATWWVRIELSPAARLGSEPVLGPSQAIDVPAAIRLDFDTGSVWFAAAMPKWPSPNEVYVLGDEVMVVFTSAKMRAIGCLEPEFLHP